MIKGSITPEYYTMEMRLNPTLLRTNTTKKTLVGIDEPEWWEKLLLYGFLKRYHIMKKVDKYVAENGIEQIVKDQTRIFELIVTFSPKHPFGNYSTQTIVFDLVYKQIDTHEEKEEDDLAFEYDKMVWTIDINETRMIAKKIINDWKIAEHFALRIMEAIS